MWRWCVCDKCELRAAWETYVVGPQLCASPPSGLESTGTTCFHPWLCHFVFIFSCLQWAAGRWVEDWKKKKENVLQTGVFIGWWWRMAACRTGVCWHLLGAGLERGPSCICRCGVNGEHSVRPSPHYTFKQEIKLSCWNIICSLQIYPPELLLTEMHEGNTAAFLLGDRQMVCIPSPSLISTNKIMKHCPPIPNMLCFWVYSSSEQCVIDQQSCASP